MQKTVERHFLFYMRGLRWLVMVTKVTMATGFPVTDWGWERRGLRWRFWVTYKTPDQ